MFSFSCQCGIMANVLDCNIIVKEFKLQSCYYIYFQTQEKYKITDYPSPSYRLNSVTAVLLQGWLWHWITHQVWCTIKTKKPTIILAISAATIMPTCMAPCLHLKNNAILKRKTCCMSNYQSSLTICNLNGYY